MFEPPAALGVTGASTQLGGYSIVIADNLDAAVKMASACPLIERGGGSEVGALADLPEEHAAEQMRAQLADA